MNEQDKVDRITNTTMITECIDLYFVVLPTSATRGSCVMEAYHRLLHVILRMTSPKVANVFKPIDEPLHPLENPLRWLTVLVSTQLASDLSVF